MLLYNVDRPGCPYFLGDPDALARPDGRPGSTHVWDMRAGDHLPVHLVPIALYGRDPRLEEELRRLNLRPIGYRAQERAVVAVKWR